MNGRTGISKTKLGLFFAALLLSASLTWAVPVWADLSDDMINELMCPSECAETLAICQMPEAVAMRTLIKEKVAAGESRDQITNFLVDRYGERILAAPLKKGFNLTAWVTPFAVILAGGGLITLFALRWLKARTVLDIRDSKALTQILTVNEQKRYEQRLLQELEQFE